MKSDVSHTTASATAGATASSATSTLGDLLVLFTSVGATVLTLGLMQSYGCFEEMKFSPMQLLRASKQKSSSSTSASALGLPQVYSISAKELDAALTSPRRKNVFLILVSSSCSHCVTYKAAGQVLLDQLRSVFPDMMSGFYEVREGVKQFGNIPIFTPSFALFTTGGALKLFNQSREFAAVSQFIRETCELPVVSTPRDTTTSTSTDTIAGTAASLSTTGGDTRRGH